MTLSRKHFALLASWVVATAALEAQAPMSSGARLQEMIGDWRTTFSTFANPGDTVPATMEVASIARGRGVRSIWRARLGAQPYEAHSTWAYDSTTARISVFEVNSLGLVATHAARFDSSGALVLDRASSSGTLLQRSWFRWRQDTLWFVAEFYGRTTRRDSIVMVRDRASRLQH